MAPAFGLVEAKGLLPYFMDTVNKAYELRLHLVSNADQGSRCQMVDKWNGLIENGKSGNSAIIGVNTWLGKATLDACALTLRLRWHGLWTNRKLFYGRIGAGAFEYDFGALDDTDNPLTKSYSNLMCGYLPLSSTAQDSNRVDHPLDSLVSGPSETPLDYSFHLCLRRNGTLD